MKCMNYSNLLHVKISLTNSSWLCYNNEHANNNIICVHYTYYCTKYFILVVIIISNNIIRVHYIYYCNSCISYISNNE